MHDYVSSFHQPFAGCLVISVTLVLLFYVLLGSMHRVLNCYESRDLILSSYIVCCLFLGHFGQFFDFEVEELSNDYFCVVHRWRQIEEMGPCVEFKNL